MTESVTTHLDPTSVICKAPKVLKKLVCIEYPGIVENVGNMIHTLNGLQAIENTYNNEDNRLELRFRPDDIYSHPVFGDRIKCNNLVVKFIRRKKTDGSYEYEAELIGLVETCYQFKSLADYQYLPIARMSKDGSQYKSIANEILPDNPLDINHLQAFNRRFNPEAPLFILPTIFSRFDMPIDYYFKNEAQHRSKDMRKEIERQNELQIIGRARKPRNIIACFLNWKDPVPTKIPQEITEALKLYEGDKKLLKNMQKAFEKRPVWSRNALVANLGCTRVEIKYLLPKVAYYFVNGPFRCMWIRFGYDPRTDKKSKIYQTLDFRVKQAYAKPMSSERIKAKRSIYQYKLPLKKNEKEKTAPILFPESLPGTSKDSVLVSKQQKIDESIYIFREGLIPAFRQLFYQLCDIEVPQIQTLIDSNDGKEPLVCSERDGWCGVGVIERIRAIMSEIIDKMLSEEKMEVDDESTKQSVDNQRDNQSDDDEPADEFLEYFEQ